MYTTDLLLFIGFCFKQVCENFNTSRQFCICLYVQLIHLNNLKINIFESSVKDLASVFSY